MNLPYDARTRQSDRGKVGLSVAVEGLQEALRQRKATPAEIARQCERGGVSTVVRPYLETLTANA